MCEDTQMYSGDRYVAGIASRDLKANPITLNSLYTKNLQNPNTVNVQRATPAELTNVFDLLGNIFLSCENLHTKINEAIGNPTIQKKTHLKYANMLIKNMYTIAKKVFIILRKVVES
jgi:hypothetical protein